MDHIYLVVPAQAVALAAVQESKEFPPRQKPASFSLDRVLEKLHEARGSQS